MQDHRGDVRNTPKFRSKKVANSIYLMRKETPKTIEKKDEKKKLRKKSSRRKHNRPSKNRNEKSNSIEAQ